MFDRIHIFFISLVVAASVGVAYAASPTDDDYVDAGTALTALTQAQTALSQAQTATAAAKVAVQRIRDRHTSVIEEPTPPSAIFTGAKIKDFAEIQAAPGAITEVADPLGSGQTVLKMTVSDKDVAPITPTENPRAQALSPDIIHSGDEFWLATKFLLPSDFPTSVPGWLSLIAIYGPPFGGSGPWEVEVSGSNISWTRNRTYNFDTPWQMPIVRGRWINVLLHERFASNGFVEMWIDGQPVTFFPGKSTAAQKLVMATMDSSNNGATGNAAKILNYRKVGMFPSITVYFGALRVGKTRASVAG